MILRTLIHRSLSLLAGVLLGVATFGPTSARADTVASLLGNFTVNQFCGLKLSTHALSVHYVVVFGQLPALRELHLADADQNGVTSQQERDAYVGKLSPGFADGLKLLINGTLVPLQVTHWTSSLPVEQGGFSLRVDVDLTAALPAGAGAGTLEFTNENYPGGVGWREVVVEQPKNLSIFDTNAYSSSLTNGLMEALQTLPAGGPLDERSVHLSFKPGALPAGSQGIAARASDTPDAAAPSSALDSAGSGWESDWIKIHTRQLIDAISKPTLEPRVIILALLGALLLGAVHALSPGHGKTIVGAYLIGSRGTPRHAAFLGVTVTITHTLGVFALGFATLYASRFVVPEKLLPILSLVSAVLVLGMGITLLIQRSRAARDALPSAGAVGVVAFQAMRPVGNSTGGMRGYAFAPNAPALDPTMHSHGGGPMHSHLPPGASGEKVTWKSLLALGISGGLVPCPSAMVLLLAAVALNKTAYGMLLVVAFSVGLALTLFAVGLAFLYARNRFSRSGKNSKWTYVLPVLSAATITVLGVALCYGALKTFT